MKKIKVLVADIVGSSTLKNTGILFLGNVFAAVLAVAFTIIAARGLEPERWGIVVAVISVVTIGEALGDLGLTSSLYRFFSKHVTSGEQELAENFRQTLLWLRLASALIVFGFLVVFSPVLSPLIFKSDKLFLTFISGLGIFSYLLLEFQITSFQASHRWAMAAFFLTLVNFLRLLGTYFLYIFGFLTTESVLWMYSGIPLLTFFVSVFWEPFSFKAVKNWKNSARQVLGFSGWLGLNRSTSAIASRIDILLLLSLTGSKQAGIFGAAKQLAIGIPLVIGSIASVLAPRFATLTGKNLYVYFRKTILLSFILGGGILLSVLFCPLIISFFGPKYVEATGTLQWLLVGFVPFAIAVPPVNFLIYALHKPKIIGLLSFVQIPLVWFLNLYLIPQFGIWGAVLVHIVWNSSTLLVAYGFVFYYLVNRKIV